MKIEARNFLYNKNYSGFRQNLHTMLKLKTNSNVVMSDNFGRLYEEDSDSYDVYLNPADIAHSDGYNPMSFLKVNGNVSETRVINLCEALCGETKDLDPYVVSTRNALLASHIYYVMECVDVHVKTLPKLYQLLTSYHEGDNNFKDSYMKSKFKREFDEWYATHLSSGKKYYEQWMLAPTSTAVDILFDLVIKLKALNDVNIRDFLAESTFDFENLRKGAYNIFVKTGLAPGKYNCDFLTAVFHSQLIDCMAELGMNGEYNHHVCINLDMYQFDLLPRFETMLAIGNGGYNLSYNVYVRDMIDLEDMSRDTHNIIMANCIEVK